MARLVRSCISFAARDLQLDRERGRGPRSADAVQTRPRSRRPWSSNLPLGVQRAHETSSADFFREFQVCGSTRNAAAVCRSRSEAAAVTSTSNEGRMAASASSSSCRSPRRTDDQRLLVGAADIHAGPPADRFQPFQNLDIGPPYSRPRRFLPTGGDLQRRGAPSAPGLRTDRRLICFCV